MTEKFAVRLYDKTKEEKLNIAKFLATLVSFPCTSLRDIHEDDPDIMYFEGKDYGFTHSSKEYYQESYGGFDTEYPLKDAVQTVTYELVDVGAPDEIEIRGVTYVRKT